MHSLVPRVRISAFAIKMANASVPGVHLSICVQRGPHSLLSNINFTHLNITFADLFLRVSEQDHCVCE